MKTELRFTDHLIIPGAKVIEIWYMGRMVGQITGADDGPGVRVISKYSMNAVELPNERATPIKIIEVRID